MSQDYILTKTDNRVAVVTLNRPKVLNALNVELMDMLIGVLEEHDADPAVRCIVLHGAGDRAFAAGADIGDMAEASVVDMYERNNLARWGRIRSVRTPIIAAVNGFCLGGGCELAMLCDMIVASETAQFGQPEINLGVIPGAGGTQRLTRAIGKYRAMEMILTGRFMTAQEALAAGLLTRVVPAEVYLDEAIKLAKEIAERPPIAVRLAKESVNKAFDTSLTEGLEYERKAFYMLFDTEDQKEGMKAFVEKRKPEFKGR